jgi:hypothetical protein
VLRHDANGVDSAPAGEDNEELDDARKRVIVRS